MKMLIVYDDTGKRGDVITDIIGEKGFGDVVVKKQRLETYFRKHVQEIFPDVEWIRISQGYEYEKLLSMMDLLDNEERVIHCFSNYLIADPKKAGLSLRKTEYIDKPYGLLEERRAAAATFPDIGSYRSFLKAILSGQKAWDAARNIPDSFAMEGVVDIGNIANFIQCITGNFDARYFNALEGNEYTITKRSSNAKKIKAEYSFYHLLPEDMRYWFVEPFDFKEDADGASYRMERLHMTDLAIKWVHGSMGEKEFEELLDKYFYFFSCRHKKDSDRKIYETCAEALYDTKVRERIAQLKTLPQYAKMEKLLAVTGNDSIDDLVERYTSLRKDVGQKMTLSYVQVIGHGDPCFANALYNKSTKTLKFIDPKGALSEEELWTDPYYDVAKLSHSVCGRYDFFNNAMYDIHIGENFEYILDIPFDNARFKEIFKRKCEENGFSYRLVRIYEVSLFLSMLPLHIDNPHKVFGFILNARDILKEIEEDV